MDSVKNLWAFYKDKNSGRNFAWIKTNAKKWYPILLWDHHLSIFLLLLRLPPQFLLNYHLLQIQYCLLQVQPCLLQVLSFLLKVRTFSLQPFLRQLQPCLTQPCLMYHCLLQMKPFLLLQIQSWVQFQICQKLPPISHLPLIFKHEIIRKK